MNILESIEDLIYEMAVNRKRIEIQIKGLSRPINLHLIKLLKWEDKINYENHLDSVNDWLNECQDNEINKKRITSDFYKKWIFTEYLPNIDKLKLLMKGSTFNKYKKLKPIRSDEEVWDIIQSIITPICNDLEKFNFNDIRDYLQTL